MTKYQFLSKVRDLKESEGWKWDWYYGGDPSSNHKTTHYSIFLKSTTGKTIMIIENGRYRGHDCDEHIKNLIRKWQKWFQDSRTTN